VAKRYASGKIALASCDRCGRTYALRDLRKEVVKGNITNVKVCLSCFDYDHPQLHLGKYPVNDPQALREPRQDSGLDDSRTLTVPGGGTVEAYIDLHTPQS